MALLSTTFFAAITFETLPVGLLGAMARGLGASEGNSGLLVSAYSVVVVLGAIPLSAMAVRFDARRTLVTVLAVFAGSAALLACSPDLPVAVAARLVGGIAHALVFTGVWRIALAIVAPDRRGRAASVLGLGNAGAFAAGVPAGTALGVATAWWTPFVVVAGVFTALAVALAVVLPGDVAARSNGPTTRAALRAARRPPLLRLGLTITLLVTGHFVTYTYVEPLLRGAGVAAHTVSLVLLLYGVTSILGLSLVAVVADRWPAAALRAVLGLLVAVVATLWLGHGSVALTIGAVVLWGLAFGSTPVLFQVLLLRAEPDVPEIGPSINNTTFNVGITLGSVAGGLVLTWTSIGGLGLVSAVILAVVLALTVRPGWLPAD